jgi:DNA-binding MltR family transcriptional regulator
MAKKPRFTELSPEARNRLLDVMKEQMTAGAGGKVLVLGSFLDTKLLELIVTNMPAIDKDTRKDLLAGTGGLSTFSSRIHLIKAFGWVEPQVARELHKMRKVRNHFAHSSTVISFDDPTLVGLVNKFDRTGMPANIKPNAIVTRVGKMLAEAIEVAIDSCKKRIADQKIVHQPAKG